MFHHLKHFEDASHHLMTVRGETRGCTALLKGSSAGYEVPVKLCLHLSADNSVFCHHSPEARGFKAWRRDDAWKLKN